ncbi:zinc transporter ZIP1-like [Clavelina lepadiformis]|uniref:zinc transporter ZIP1-like n=1 Tax=Clavelina lepadiformis TaxID=159417 RepID=UPI0040410C31
MLGCQTPKKHYFNFDVRPDTRRIMKILVVKITSALVLWILSLCFGLMVPFLIWKSRAGYQHPTRQNECDSSERENLLSDNEITPQYDSTTRSSERLSSFKLLMKKFYQSLCSYNILSFINCVCGGLFLGICLLELLPEARASVQDVLQKANIQTKFPVTEFIVAVGLLFVMLIEQLVMAAYVKRRACEHQQKSIDGGNAISPETFNQQFHDIEEASGNISASEDENCHMNCEINVLPSRPSSNVTAATEVARALVLIGVLSVHSIFEGLALGLESTVAQLIQLLVAVAVHKSVLAFGLGLKLFETFTPNNVVLAVACACIFCSSSPIGCVIGICVSHPGNVSSLESPTPWPPTASMTTYEQNSMSDVSGTLIASAILECLAMGTFLYVTFIEVIPGEFAHKNEDAYLAGDLASMSQEIGNRKKPITPYVKLVALILGFSAVTGLQFL